MAGMGPMHMEMMPPAAMGGMDADYDDKQCHQLQWPGWMFL
jgi:hypothetical protein